VSQQLRLLEGEERIADLEATATSSVMLTNRRVFLTQQQEGVERITPLKLEHISCVELMKESPKLRYLIAALLVCTGGAALLPQLVQALGAIVYSSDKLPALLLAQIPGLLLGALGLVLVVLGLLLLSKYLRSALYPISRMVFKGTAEVSVNVSTEVTDMAREMICLIQTEKGSMSQVIS